MSSCLCIFLPSLYNAEVFAVVIRHKAQAVLPSASNRLTTTPHRGVDGSAPVKLLTNVAGFKGGCARLPLGLPVQMGEKGGRVVNREVDLFRKQIQHTGENTEAVNRK